MYTIKYIIHPLYIYVLYVRTMLLHICTNVQTSIVYIYIYIYIYLSTKYIEYIVYI